MRADDEEFMAEASALAEAGRLRTPPWPWVGCVIVRDGGVVGRGVTGPYPIGPHAEVAALADAGAHARGATAYVTLEPCDHHGNTPPCSEALVAAGIVRVVAAMGDPDRRVAGRGLATLRQAGIEVDVGVGAAGVGRSLMAYLQHRRTGRPLCVAKVAMSLDARVAAADGSSRWITGPGARRDVHRLRAESQAIVVGSGTALADQPALDVRDVPPARVPPLRVLLDGRGRVPAAGPLFEAARGPTLVCTSEGAPQKVRDAWMSAGADVEVCPTAPIGPGLEPAAVLSLLGGRGVLQALVEGGPAVHAAFLAADCVDRVVAYCAPTLLGTGGRPAFAVGGPATIGDAHRWHVDDVRELDGDVRIVAIPTGTED